MPYIAPEHVQRERARRAAWIAEAEEELRLTAEFSERMLAGHLVPKEPRAS